MWLKGKGLWQERARAFARSERGSIAVMSVGVFGLLGYCGVIAADLGTVYLERREAQGAVDLAAISAVRNLDQADRIVRTVLADNGIDGFKVLQVTIGRYSADPAIAVSSRFDPAALPANAVKVELRKITPVFFARPLVHGDGVEIGVEAVAAATDLAAFSIGSRLLSVDGGVLNTVLGGTLGTTFSLSAVDYRALASADVDLFQTLDALAMEADIEAATYQDVLDADVRYSDLVNATSAALGVSAAPATVAAMNRLAGGAHSTSAEVNVGELVDLGPYAGNAMGAAPAGLDGGIPVLPTLAAAAMLANGDNQVSVDLSAAFPGLLSVELTLAIGEPAQESGWLAIGPEGTVVHTAQVLLGLRLTAGGSGVLEHVKIELPFLVEVAQAEATLSSISCLGLTPDQVAIDARPGIANAWIGDLDPYDLHNMSEGAVTEAEIVDGMLVSVDGRSHAEAAAMDAETLIFTADDISEGRIQTVGTHDASESLATSLVDDLALQVEAFGISLDGRVPDAVRNQLHTLAEPVDELFASLFELLGVGLGEADVAVHGVRCGGPGLVG